MPLPTYPTYTRDEAYEKFGRCTHVAYRGLTLYAKSLARQLGHLSPFSGEEPAWGLILEPAPKDSAFHAVVIFAEDHEKLEWIKGYVAAVQEANHGKIDSAGGRI